MKISKENIMEVAKERIGSINHFIENDGSCDYMAEEWCFFAAFANEQCGCADEIFLIAEELGIDFNNDTDSDYMALEISELLSKKIREGAFDTCDMEV